MARTRHRQVKGKSKAPPEPPEADSARRQQPRPRWRRWAARLLAAVLAPTLFLTVVELGLRLFGYGYDTSFFVKAGDRKTYVSNPKFDWRFLGPDLSREGMPRVIADPKPAGAYRIYVLGGSAAEGIPNTAFSFSRILEAMLNERFPQTRFEVVNAGWTAINSHVVLPIAKGCARHEPDLLIVYMGHNEVIGPYGAGTVFRGFTTSLGTIRASIWLRSTRLGQLLGNSMRALAGRDPDQRKDWGGMEMFIRNRVTHDDPRLEVVYRNFRANLEEICAEGRRAGAKVIVSTVVVNLRDCPPFESVHRAGLSDGEKTRWDKLYRQGVALEDAGDHAKAAGRYRAAEGIDDQFAELHYRLGRCCVALKRYDHARRRFVRACDLDALRFRADTRINRIIREVAGHKGGEGVHLVDTESVVVSHDQAENGIPGRQLFHEHVHLNFRGNYAVAAVLFGKVVELLPAGVRGEVGADVSPPTLERCADLTTLTAFDRWNSAGAIAGMAGRPPFPRETHAQATAAAERLNAELTPRLLAQVATRYQQALERRPNDFLLRGNYVNLQMHRGQYDVAAEQCRILLDRFPHVSRWSWQLAEALASQGRIPEAISQWRSLLKRKPNSLRARRALALAFLGAGNTEEAVAHLEAAIDAAPNDPSAHYHLGCALAGQGRLDEAIAEFRQAAALKPAIAAKARSEIGGCLLQQGRVDEAIAEYRAASRASDRDPAVLCNLGNALIVKGSFEEAISSFDGALRVDPQLVQARRGLVQALQKQAWIYATHRNESARNGDRAVALARRACGLAGGEVPLLLDTLAAAYAEKGHFDRAVETGLEAKRLAELLGDRRLATQISSRLRLYRAGKPHRMLAPR